MSNREDEVDHTYGVASSRKEGLGPSSGGQSGDTQGLGGTEDVDSESVLELVEEGQFFEAEAISGIENADEPGITKSHTRLDADDVTNELDDRSENETDPADYSEDE